jgi:CRP/FNR family transcriptional regulator, cyclic AMP receptor protein
LGSKKDLSELLADVGLFSRCTTRQRRAIARHAQIAELPAGVDLIKEGEPGDALFVIIDGRAIITKDSVELNRVGPGAYFGELAILDGEPRSATVVAETDVKVAVIGIRMFRTLLREFSDLAEQLMIALAGELREARKMAERAAAGG